VEHQTPAALLRLEGLRIHFRTEEGTLHAVDGIDLHIDRGETLGIVGESGCGKSVTAMSIMKLLAMPPGFIAGGRILFEGKDLVQASAASMRRIRAREIAMIFQEPMTSLNPVFSVGEQIAETLRLHQGLDRKAALSRTIEMLAMVNIPKADRRVHDYPHQFSGGMRQRVMIAAALSCSPELILADEPTTALDVTIQDQILRLLVQLQGDLGLGMVLVTHDMGVVAQTCQRVAVMYAGEIVELATTADLFAAPRHPYAAGLLACVPRIEGPTRRLLPIRGAPPDLAAPPAGCRFHPRCPMASDTCRSLPPPLREVGPGHLARCHHAERVTAAIWETADA